MNLRTTSLFFLLLLVGTSRGFGGAPERIDGLIYYETGRDVAHFTYDFANVLSANGTFSQLYTRLQPSAPPFVTSDPVDGIYVYRKLSDTTAELTLTPSSRGPGNTRTLNFRSDTEGGVQGQAFFVGGSFRFAPLSSATSALVNCSNRSFINPGKSAFTGFVVTGGTGLTGRTVLVRAVGPGLGIFGITDFLRNPAVSVIRASDNSQMGSNDDWSSESAMAINRTGMSVGAFPLAGGSKDAVVILNLKNGAYIAQVSSPDGTDTGQALIEVYILP